jgi:oxygen-independent coproporphyrinogen-3 oxidase
MLSLEEGTRLYQSVASGELPEPDGDLAADMYEWTTDALEADGFWQYEISNWARDKGRRTKEEGIKEVLLPAFACRHNLTYWRNEPYLGFGAGAHACFGGERFWNVASPLEYIQRVARGESAVAGRERISRELEMAETMILGLRLNEGIVFAKFAERYGEDAHAKYARQLRESRELGLLELLDERARLTPRGRLLSNQVFWRLLP